MKIISPLGAKKARLEIVPLIDIMFFLLASFMMVTMSMTKQRTIDVNLPAAATSHSNLKPDVISLAVDARGQVFLDKDMISLEALDQMLKERLSANKELPVYISGDAATPHGAMIAVLDYVKRCGVTKVAFNVKPVDKQ
ncbi:biopolymer transporter ExbD [Verrucomicrobium sp. BvORR106]|uniref:ExbD/TolR family protein n=1 Tax=Verrucomicrobium sp. BvORR106 TaxID=1403819 RepID=UPI00056F66F2|nr:biopolymer transporter ExbD [Verrucomicrobium sp. BvORR106]